MNKKNIPRRYLSTLLLPHPLSYANLFNSPQNFYAGEEFLLEFLHNIAGKVAALEAKIKALHLDDTFLEFTHRIESRFGPATAALHLGGAPCQPLAKPLKPIGARYMGHCLLAQTMGLHESAQRCRRIADKAVVDGAIAAIKTARGD